MNIGQSISKQRIAELDAIVQEIIVGDTHDESGDNPSDPNQPTTSANGRPYHYFSCQDTHCTHNVVCRALWWNWFDVSETSIQN